MVIDVLTLFPAMFKPVLSESILKRAQSKEFVKINLHNLRNWADDKRGTVDDKPFGGGAGMVLKPEPIFKSVESLRREDSYTVLLGPRGKALNQHISEELAGRKHLILICGHYEDVDERVREHLIDCEVSIGDYILTCGELPAMVLIDSVVRLIPGGLGNEDANLWESFSRHLLEYPQYTRPADFRGLKVPDVLLGGDHKKIEQWRKEQSLKRTRSQRPDLYEKYLRQ